MAEFADQLKVFIARIQDLKPHLTTEEATKTSIILPFFNLLGYDIFNPLEFVPEYTADVGIKKGEKVDYAVMKDGSPVILIECKSVTENLASHGSQLFRYFGTTKAKFSILTNGVVYQFYTDLEDKNKMDERPFLEIDLLNLKKNQIPELMKFQKSSFDIEVIANAASELKYIGLLQNYFAIQLADPTDEFSKLMINSCYSGKITQQVIDRFRPYVKRALNQYISEKMIDKITTVVNTEKDANAKETETAIAVQVEDAKIVTTDEELEAFYIIRSFLGEYVHIKRVIPKDTESYFGILLDGNTRKWICRFQFKSSKIWMFLPGEGKEIVKIQLSELEDLYRYRAEIKSALDRYLQESTDK